MNVACPRCESLWLYRDEEDELICCSCGHAVVASLLAAKA